MNRQDAENAKASNAKGSVNAVEHGTCDESRSKDCSSDPFVFPPSMEVMEEVGTSGSGSRE